MMFGAWTCGRFGVSGGPAASFNDTDRSAVHEARKVQVTARHRIKQAERRTMALSKKAAAVLIAVQVGCRVSDAPLSGCCSG